MSNRDGLLAQYIRQIEGVNGEIKSLNTDKSEIYKAAKHQGYDPKIIRKVVAERAKGPAERAEADELFRLYWDQAEQPELPLLQEMAS